MAVHCAKNDFWTAKIAFYFFVRTLIENLVILVHILYFGVNNATSTKLYTVIPRLARFLWQPKNRVR